MEVTVIIHNITKRTLNVEDNIKTSKFIQQLANVGYNVRGGVCQVIHRGTDNLVNIPLDAAITPGDSIQILTRDEYDAVKQNKEYKDIVARRIGEKAELHDASDSDDVRCYISDIKVVTED